MLSVPAIKKLWDSADEAESKSNQNRWKIAQAIVQHLDAKIMTQVIIAQELGRNQALVSRNARVWREFGDECSIDDSFQEKYLWVQDNPKGDRAKAKKADAAEANAQAAMQAEPPQGGTRLSEQ